MDPTSPGNRSTYSELETSNPINVIWEFLHGDEWIPYTDEISALIDECQVGETISFKQGKFSFRVCKTGGQEATEINLNSDKERVIRRREEGKILF